MICDSFVSQGQVLSLQPHFHLFCFFMVVAMVHHLNRGHIIFEKSLSCILPISCPAHHSLCWPFSKCTKIADETGCTCTEQDNTQQ